MLSQIGTPYNIFEERPGGWGMLSTFTDRWDKYQYSSVLADRDGGSVSMCDRKSLLPMPCFTDSISKPYVGEIRGPVEARCLSSKWPR